MADGLGLLLRNLSTLQPLTTFMKLKYSNIQSLCILLLMAVFLCTVPACSPGDTSAAGNDSAASDSTTVTSKKITLGIIPLTDCAPLVIAHEKGFFKKYGLDVEISKEASWANVRDKILTGELDGAHCLFGMPFSVYTGVGGKAGSEMHIAMVLNNNGQAITLSKEFCGQINFQKMDGVSAAVEKLKARKEPTFAMTFPGGTHDIWLLTGWLLPA